ncbi:hypothetical protein ACHAPE_008441 [Trichoderma viride]
MTLDITTDQWLAGAKYRRSIYGLKGTSHVSDERIKEIVENVLSFTPSAWNCQHARLTLVLGEKHTQLWDVVQKEAEPVLKGISEDLWKLMGPRIQGFRNAYGSILFWNSEDSIREAKINHKNGAHIIPEWSEHAIGMCQILIWTALEIEGFGANLPHMNGIPTLDACIKEFAHIPNDYVLKATMTFGEEAQPHPETIPGKLPYSETLQILK